MSQTNIFSLCILYDLGFQHFKQRHIFSSCVQIFWVCLVFVHFMIRTRTKRAISILISADHMQAVQASSFRLLLLCQHPSILSHCFPFHQERAASSAKPFRAPLWPSCSFFCMRPRFPEKFSPAHTACEAHHNAGFPAFRLWQ